MAPTATAVRQLDTDQQEDVRELLSIYSAHRDAISAAVRAEVDGLPAAAHIAAAEQAPERSGGPDESMRLLHRAVEAGEWDAYRAYLRAQGRAFARSGLDFSAWFSILSILRRQIEPYLVGGGDPHREAAARRGLSVLLEFALAAIGEAYLAEKERRITSQQEALLELSTPVLRLREGLLLLPIVGSLDTERARQLTTRLLDAIATDRARTVVLDVTGLPAVDTGVANHLIRTVEAARLMGATSFVTGLSAANAETLVRLGVDLRGIRTVGTLEHGVQAAVRVLAASNGGPADLPLDGLER